jgi:phospholipid-binding lipoprotein MlaA
MSAPFVGAALFAGMLACAFAAPAIGARLESPGSEPLWVETQIETRARSDGAFSDESGEPEPGGAIETSAPADAQPDATPSEPSDPDELFEPPTTSDEELASIDDGFLDEDLGPDPAERDLTPRWNRRVFAFNEGFIRSVMQPISRGYQALTPKFVREMIQRSFENLESPVILANDMMQLDPCRAGRTFGRFALNSTVGVLGLFDVATEMGIEAHDTDFGETLGRWGVRSGSYFMLPVLGPSTARDTFGELVDTALRPEVWLLGGFPSLALSGGDGLSTYDIQSVRLDALRETSIDFYAALRSAYLMDRDAKIEELRKAGRCRFGKKKSAE